MDYANSEMKIDQLIGYFNEKKINLIPPFQRGHVWKLKARQKLMENIVMGRPIPAIFLYKQADGSKYSYNILDGKQRLESLLLFVGGQRADVRIENVKSYFYHEREKSMVGFTISVHGKKQTFKELPEAKVRDFREYSIPTIEINLDDESGSLDEIINLFVDINQYGEKVKRFDIVKAIGQGNALLRSVLDLIAIPQKRKEDLLYKKKHTAFTRVLERLQTVQDIDGPNEKVDRMWERLVELVLFVRSGKHRQPGQILRSFIKSDDATEQAKVASSELKKLQTVFGFLANAYKKTDLANTRLARDTPHFYTMVTSLISTGMLVPKDGVEPDFVSLQKKLLAFSKLLVDNAAAPDNAYLAERIEKYKQAAARQTTHPGQRDTRQKCFLEIIDKL